MGRQIGIPGQRRQSLACRRVIGIGGQGATIERLGVSLFPFGLGDLTKTIIRILALGAADSDRGQIILPRFRPPGQPAIDAGAIVQCGDQIRGQGQRGAIVVHRIGQAAHAVQQQAAVKQHPNLIVSGQGPAFDRQGIIGQRVVLGAQPFAVMAAHQQGPIPILRRRGCG